MPRLTRRAQKDLADLPESMRSKAEGIINRLDLEPALGHKLLGKLAGKRSARLGRSHRIIYRVDQEGGAIVAVVVLTITARKDAYR